VITLQSYSLAGALLLNKMLQPVLEETGEEPLAPIDLS